MSNWQTVISVLLVSIPFLLLALLSAKNNLKKEYRSRQGFMPILAIVFCIVVSAILDLIVNWLFLFLRNIDNWIEDFAIWLGGLFDGTFDGLSKALISLANTIESFFSKVDLTFWAAIIVNTAVILAYIVFKRIVITLLKVICKEDKRFYNWCAKLAYEQRSEDNKWYVKSHLSQGVTLTKSLYYISIIFGMFGIAISAYMYSNKMIASLYYPVLSVIMMGEIYFFMDGVQWGKKEGSLSGESDRSTKICDYTFMRQILRRSFADKLLSDNTTVNHSELLSFRTNEEVVSALEENDDSVIEAYGLFMRKKSEAGLKLDHNYLMSGLDLLNGKSVLFNNPFYYDLIPYIFYPMNRAILRRKKVLIVLGRHVIEKDVEKWCRDGLTEISGIPSLWNIGVLSKETQDLDVGIVTRSSVHDFAMHESNSDFFAQVDFVVLIEPSRLISTAQIGLNSIIRYCRRDGNDPVFCSTDKNCDGIVDALSHVLMTSLEEVSATNKHKGTSSYMCWEADEEHLQHRMLPNLSRYLGVGTELSFAALKRQISKTCWYGGEAFPVLDMHWIAKQYHYDLMNYAALPPQQALFDEVFESSPNMWDARIEDNNYLTVEDENYNMYEIKRTFSTRAANQGFINVISTDYLLKDYMAANDGIFDADSKAIPYIVADYAHTNRNVIYRLFLRLSTTSLNAEDIEQEMSLINVAPGENIIDTLWEQLCRVAQGVGVRHFNEKTGEEELYIVKEGKEYIFDSSVIEMSREYCFETGLMEDTYSVQDKTFINVLLGDLLSAEYIAENETGDNNFLGTELRGHIFQKYLPGQFFVFGGKYYEMLGLTLSGRVIVRRAADHITGRPQYRQIRNYKLDNITLSDAIASSKDMGAFSITKQYADISVETPAYWQMNRYNDFATAKKIAINGVPVREYNNKQFLRIDFSEEIIKDKTTLDTIAALMNEAFRTLYAENQNMIVAVTPGQAEMPLSYSLQNVDFAQNSIYIIEDSQLDIGLLISVERNLNRIFSIICDYLEWHNEVLEKSKTPPTQDDKPDFTLTDEQREEKKEETKKGFFKKIGEKVKNVFSKIGGFFKNLFKKKSKNEGDSDSQTDDTSKKKKRKEKKVKDKKRKKGKDAAIVDNIKEVSAEQGDSEIADDTVEESVEPKVDESIEEISDETAESSVEEPEEEQTEKEIEDIVEVTEEKEPFDEETNTDSDETDDGDVILMSITPSKELYDIADAQLMAEDNVDTTTSADDENSLVESEVYAESEDAIDESEIPIDQGVSDEQNISVEELSESAENAGNQASDEQNTQKQLLPTRSPYHERYYLLFGGEEEPSTINVNGALEALQQLGFGKGSLGQARSGIFNSEVIEQSIQSNQAGTHRCDYCGVELFGAEYEVQADGRERCNICSRTAVKSEAEFQKIYDSVVRNMSIFFGITFTAPIKVEMVNAKKLHKKLGKTFVPTADSDARVLGVAIRDKKNNYTILLENGTPRLSAIMTMVHELTHIWQYLNWDATKIQNLYGKNMNLQVYEGMAKWVEIQYAFLVNESGTAKREEIITRLREDEYGFGFLKYSEVYPLSYGTMLTGETPFMNPDKPL